MNLSLFYSVILISFGAAAFYLGVSATRKRFREYLGNSFLGILCFASCLWSYGFGILFLTKSVEVAYWGRTIGMLGVFGYLIMAQMLVGVLGQIPRKEYLIFCGYSLLGIPIYFLTVARSATVYSVENGGMTYTFNPGLANNLYTIYSVIYAVNMVISVTQMIKYSQDRRSKVSGKRMMATLLIVYAGMVFDTIIPMFGANAIPGSSMAQFLGLLVVYYAIVDYNGTRITDRNMSQYVYSSFAEPVVVLDTEGNLKLMNKAAKLLFPSILKRVGEEKIFIGEVIELADDFFAFESDHRLNDCYTCELHIPVQIQTNKIRDKYGDMIGYILTLKDMTAITKAMDSLRDAKAQAEANNLAKSTFLANMSHEIRTPLNAVVGFSELLLKSNLSPEDKDSVEDILTSSHNLLAIINDVLDISKIESGRMELSEEPYEIKSVINDAYLITDTLARKKNLSFAMEMDGSIPMKLHGDAVRIRGVLVNILNNAVKYTPTGSVTLKGELLQIRDDIATLRFEIKDTGIGIKKEDLPKLFDSFLRVDKSKNSGIEGTGLGLAIVKGFVELMGGEITVESEYGEGTVFAVTIPQKIVDATPIGTISTKTDAARKGSSIGDIKYKGVKVLAVDDNGVNLKLISNVLRRYEMEVTTAKSGPESIALCKEGQYDVVLMDQMMPGMDGIEAMKQIRAVSDHYAAGGKCVIIALTANAIMGVREELLTEGFDDYLSKPINFPQMEEVFNHYLEPNSEI